MQLAFSMLLHTLKQPFCKAFTHSCSTLSPYITVVPTFLATVVLTFLATIVLTFLATAVLEHTIPWAELATFLNTILHRCRFSFQQNLLLDTTITPTQRWTSTSNMTPTQRWTSASDMVGRPRLSTLSSPT
ncbi:hypothetical protein WOLCODRAFT_154042 [Wolfiporia cocos MD-104 SS10]|uniref:Uncharacterized protein n=1 Tax=Wolfiporia cocos (strain MD-104) TaxID=742152 RepID=A0A2H3K1J1_WOLCO|nr:hypothetical protein WOLCODRAFT_154042 [Wolfiporia cocos MD-104 SS10]